MTNWRDHKEKMRRIVHNVMQIPANMYRGTAAPVVVYVRLQNLKETFHGDLVGTSFNYAVMQDQNPVIVSMTENYDPLNGDVLSFRNNEAYRVDNVQVPDFITTTAELTILSAAEAASYPPPSTI